MNTVPPRDNDPEGKLINYINALANDPGWIHTLQREPIESIPGKMHIFNRIPWDKYPHLCVFFEKEIDWEIRFTLLGIIFKSLSLGGTVLMRRNKQSGHSLVSRRTASRCTKTNIKCHDFRCRNQLSALQLSHHPCHLLATDHISTKLPRGACEQR